jgi:tetratricopeptide (TPR) repeat protein
MSIEAASTNSWVHSVERGEQTEQLSEQSTEIISPIQDEIDREIQELEAKLQQILCAIDAESAAQAVKQRLPKGMNSHLPIANELHSTVEQELEAVSYQVKLLIPVESGELYSFLIPEVVLLNAFPGFRSLQSQKAKGHLKTIELYKDKNDPQNRYFKKETIALVLTLALHHFFFPVNLSFNILKNRSIPSLRGNCPLMMDEAFKFANAYEGKELAAVCARHVIYLYQCDFNNFINYALVALNSEHEVLENHWLSKLRLISTKKLNELETKLVKTLKQLQRTSHEDSQYKKRMIQTLETYMAVVSNSLTDTTKLKEKTQKRNELAREVQEAEKVLASHQKLEGSKPKKEHLFDPSFNFLLTDYPDIKSALEEFCLQFSFENQQEEGTQQLSISWAIFKKAFSPSPKYNPQAPFDLKTITHLFHFAASVSSPTTTSYKPLSALPKDEAEKIFLEVLTFAQEVSCKSLRKECTDYLEQQIIKKITPQDPDSFINTIQLPEVLKWFKVASELKNPSTMEELINIILVATNQSLNQKKELFVYLINEGLDGIGKATPEFYSLISSFIKTHFMKIFNKAFISELGSNRLGWLFQAIRVHKCLQLSFDTTQSIRDFFRDNIDSRDDLLVYYELIFLCLDDRYSSKDFLLEDLRTSITHFEQQSMLSEESENLHFLLLYTLGFFALSQGNLQVALEAGDNVQAVNPNGILSHELLGNIYLKKEEFTQALHHFNQVLDIQPFHHCREQKEKIKLP